jgi:hypothetical protein
MQENGTGVSCYTNGGTPDRKITLERPRRRWKDNIKIAFQRNEA